MDNISSLAKLQLSNVSTQILLKELEDILWML